MNSGYVIVDGSGIDFSDLGEVEGIHAKLKAAIATGKAVILEGTKYGTLPYTPIAVTLADAGDSGIYMDKAGGSYTVSTADVITSNNNRGGKKS